MYFHRVLAETPCIFIRNAQECTQVSTTHKKETILPKNLCSGSKIKISLQIRFRLLRGSWNLKQSQKMEISNMN